MLLVRPLAIMIELVEQGEPAVHWECLHSNILREKRAIEEMNGKLVELADKDSIYEEAPLMCFGDWFAKEVKDGEDQL